MAAATVDTKQTADRTEAQETATHNAAAIERLFVTHANTVVKFLSQRSSPQVAEELCAQVFEDAYEQFERGRGHQVTIAWLITVSRRRLYDHWRSIGRSRLLATRLGAVNPPAADHEAEMVETALVRGVLDTLPAQYRHALILRYFNGHSVADVAALMGRSYNAAESMLARARKAFATEYHSEYENRTAKTAVSPAA